jgi:ribonuclease HI
VCHAELKGWLLDWIGKGSAHQIEWMFTMIYNLWQARNDARETKQMQDPKTIVLRTATALEEWRGLMVKPLSVPSAVKVNWQPPAIDWYKINVDGAFRQQEGIGGGGVVIRDHHGSFTAGACCFFTHVADAEGAELLACRKGLLLAKELRANRVILETDNTGVRAKLLKLELDRSVHGSLVEEIKVLLGSFSETAVCVVRRTANAVAHALAKNGCDNKLCKIWLVVPSAGIVNTLVSDVSVN